MHIGIILDGNGRWATAKGLPRLSGHKAGVENLKTITKACPELKVHTLTVYAFAIANWKRDQDEVDGLWKLFRHFFKRDVNELLSDGVRIKVIGNRVGLPADIVGLIEEVETKSKGNNKLLLQVALNYDGVEEVARLLKRSLEGEVDPAEVTPEYVLNNLDTEADNEPDIVVRTGMDKPQADSAIWRGSAFLPLQSAQSVCVSTTTLWPDFSAEHLKEIITYAKPEDRLFGGQRK